MVGDSCVVTLSATANNREPGNVQVTVDVVKATQNAPGASAVYGTPTLVTGGTQQVVAAPNGGHGTLSYRSATGTICTVDPTTGLITARLNGNCTIEAKWGGNASYQASEWGAVQTIAIGLGTLTITAPGSFSGNLVVGGDSLAPTSPTTSPSGASFSYVLKSGETDCTLDATTGASLGTVSAATVAVTANTTACTLVVTATLNGYNPATAEVSVNLEEGTLVFSDTPAPAYAGRGFATSGTTEIGDIPASDDNSIAVTWSFAAAGTRAGSTQANVCSVDNTNSATLGDITAGSDAQDGDECTITMTATASVPGYGAWSRDVTLLAGFTVVVEITGGESFYCARFDNGKVKCWGRGIYLGIGPVGDKGDDDGEMGANLPFLDFGTNTVKKLATNNSNSKHNCAILNDDNLRCWGGNFSGALGYGGNNNDSTKAPGTTNVNLGGNLTAVQVSLGGYFTCAVLNDGSLKCWGNNGAGQLGYGDTTDRSPPVVSNPPATTDVVNLGVNKTARQVALGSDAFSCAILNDNTVKCWGKGASGRLGYGDSTNRNAPEATDTLDFGQDDEEQPKTAVRLFPGEYSTCALLNDNSLACWGHWRWSGISTPQVVDFGDGKSVKFAALSAARRCVILNDDTVRCWGENQYGQLGYNDTTDRWSLPSTAVNLGTDRTALMLAFGGRDSTCALLDDHTVKCWGRNNYGQLGAGAGVTNWGDGVDEDGNSVDDQNNPIDEMGDNLPVVELL